MRLFDTHAHVGLIHTEQLEQLMAIEYAKRVGVKHIVSISNSLTDFEKNYQNLKSSKSIYHAVGLSPTETGGFRPHWEDRLVPLAQRDKVIAIGESGLDYVKMRASKQTQIEAFLIHLEAARKLDLPIIIHNREAGYDILNILKTKIPARGAIFHCYSEDVNFAMEAMELPVYFSFAGNITYRSVKPLIDTVRMLPLNRILIESESPFMAPSKYSKKRNRPEYIVENAKAIAYIKSIPFEKMTEILYENSLKAFNLEENE
ncbi:MAG: YchF/TatD family DNA exonuclease [Sphaerochaetaceae bacterium]